jgi:beta-glucanase (GH16 family)
MIIAAVLVLVAGVAALGVAAFRPPRPAPAAASASAAAPPGVQQAVIPAFATLRGPAVAPPPPAGYQQVFLDDFNGPAGTAPDQQNWHYDVGSGRDWGNHEVDDSVSSTSSVFLDGHGDLVIKALEAGGTWTSGRIQTVRDDFAAPAGGRVEMTASIQQPDVANAAGYWPAFWALGSPSAGSWPQAGEMDILEDINGNDKVSQTLHDGGSDKGHEPVRCPGVVSCEAGFHTYSAVIDRTNANAEFVRFLVDGTVEKTITEAQVGAAVWRAAIDHGFLLILNLALGGNYPDAYCDCTSPTSATTPGGEMKVAYVAVYQQGG